MKKLNSVRKFAGEKEATAPSGESKLLMGL